MAKVIEAFDFRVRHVHWSYDWDSWLNGQIWQLEEGVDYTCKSSSIRLLAIGAAKRRKLRVHVSVNGKTGVVTLQAYPRDAKDGDDEEAFEVNGKEAEGNGHSDTVDSEEIAGDDDVGQAEGELKKLSVKKLRALLDENTIPYPLDADKAALIQAAMEAGV